MPIRALILLPFLLSTGCAYYPDPAATNLAELDSLPAVGDRRTARAAAIDERIEINAREALGDDPLIPFQSHLNINAYNGTLLVTGQTPDESLHQQIIEKVRIIAGVKRVQDEIAPTPTTFPSDQANDSLITSRLQMALDNQPHSTDFSSSHIKIITENGSVYLMGLVYPDEADLVTGVAQRIPGVIKVVKLFEYLQ